MVRAIYLVCCLLCGGCPTTPARPAAIQIQITDDHGHTVSLAGPARRIVSLSPSNTEILFAVGCGEGVVLRDRLSSFPEAARRLPATNPFQLSPDHVAGFSPDLVLLTHADSSRVEALRRLGLAVAILEPRSLDAVYDDIHVIARLCGNRPRARRLVQSLKHRVQAVVQRVRGRARPSVFIETDGTDPLKPWTCGRGSFVDQIVRLAGGRSVTATLDRPFAQVNAEEILAANPDVILAMGVDRHSGARGLQRLRSRQGWSSLEAVRQGRVIDTIDADLLSRPGPRLVDGLEALAHALHPGAWR